MKKFTFVFFGFDCYDFPFAYHLKQEGYEVIMVRSKRRTWGCHGVRTKRLPKSVERAD